MTLAQALTCLRELRALERLARAVTERPARSFEWRCGLVALDDRIRLLRYYLSVEDPALLAAVEERYRFELLQPAEEFTPHSLLVDLPRAARIH